MALVLDIFKNFFFTLVEFKKFFFNALKIRN